MKLGTHAVDEVRRRVQQQIHGHRGRRNDPLYGIRNILRCAQERLTDRQQTRLSTAFAADERHIEVDVAWQCVQQLRSVYHQQSRAEGRRIAEKIIDTLPSCPIPEIARLGKTLKQWKAAFLGYFDTGGANNGGTEAICECGGWLVRDRLGQDGVGRADQRVTLEAIGPLRRCSSVELSTLGSAADTARPTSVT